MILGCIADDFTGATDLANMLVRGGMRTIQTIGVPAAKTGDVDAVVVALKTRTIAREDAVAQSLAALKWLKANGAQQIYFKYCSTFDSTPKGNIGPVMDALMKELKTDFTIACPAFPENGRTIFRGYLYVGDVLLSESGMKDHPLTPMADANLVRVLQPQTARTVGLIKYDTVARGADAMRECIAALKIDGVGAAVVDAVSDADLKTIGSACANMPLVTAGSGVGLGLALHYRDAGHLKHVADAAQLPTLGGRSAVVSGSCSLATNGQVKHWIDAGNAAIRVDTLKLAADTNELARIIKQALDGITKGPVLVYATAPPEEVKRVQASLGVERAGQITEAALAAVAKALIEQGDVTKLVVAGGETSGAVVQALGVESLRIGPQIDPGVPWTATGGAKPIALALKSGNFGTVDFFSKAFQLLESPLISPTETPSNPAIRATTQKPTIVLDKNFLQGSSTKDIRNLAISNRLLMSDVLFYELISKREDWKKCFVKFPKTENPVDLVKHLGGLLRLELETQKSCGKPSGHIEKIRFQFNEGLLRDTYKLPEDAQIAADDHAKELRDDVDSFVKAAQTISALFPNLLDGSDLSRKIAREQAEEFIANDTDALLRFFDQFEAPPGERPLPPARLLNRNWALFRWLQVKLLFAIDLHVRHQGNIPTIDTLSAKSYELLEHDVLDAQYLILGILEESFATREKKLIRWWKLLCPEGKLWQ